MATTLAARGCQVIVSGRREAPLDALANSSPNITACPSDVTNSSDQTALVKSLSDLPAPRALFHGAGYFQLGRLNSLSKSDWQNSFETNVTARWALSKMCAPHLDGGRILFVGSDSSTNVRVGATAYSIAQSASETLRRALQVEWVDRNIAVAGFKPGLVDTDMVRGFLAKPAAEFPAKSAFQAYIDRGEFAMPELVATFAAWLLLDVDATRYETTEWDLRDTDHHPEWRL